MDNIYLSGEIVMKVRNCPICFKNKSSELFRFTYDYLLKVQKVDESFLSFVGFDKDSFSSIVCCEHCDFTYLRENYEWDLKYEDYWKIHGREKPGTKFGRKKSFEERRLGNLANQKIISGLLMLIKPPRDDEYGKSKWLDFGCGDGHVALMAHGINFVEIYGYDINNEKLKGPSRKGLKIFNSIDAVTTNGPYDCIICTDVIEHVSEPRDIISFISDNLCPNGILYVQVPLKTKKQLIKDCINMKKGSLISTYHCGHLNYFSYDNFKEIMNHYGLHSCNVQSIWGGLEFMGDKFFKIISSPNLKSGLLYPPIKLLLGQKYNLHYFRK